MSAKLIHLYSVNGQAVGIFDQLGHVVAEVGGFAGMSELDARRIVASWNLTAELTLEELEALIEFKGVKA